MIRLNVEPCLTVIIKRQFGPVACNCILIRECGFGHEVFNLVNTAAEIISFYLHRLRLFEEQSEGDPVQEFLEAIAANVDLNLRCSNVRNALDGDHEVFAYISNYKGSAVRIRHQLVEFITVRKHLKVRCLGITVVDLNNKIISEAVSNSCFNSVTDNGISCACGKRDIVNFIERNPVSHRVSCNVGRRDRMLLIVRLCGVFSVYERDLFAVHPHGKVVCIGYGEFGGTIVFCVVLNTGDDRRFGVHSLNIAAAAELFVGIGFPYAVMRMADDLNIPGDADAAVNDIAAIHILIRQTRCQAVIERLALDGNIGELAAGNVSRCILPDEQISADAVRHGQRAAGFGGDRTGISTARNIQRSAGLEEDAVFIGAAVGLQTAAIVDGDLAADVAALRLGKSADGKCIGDLTGSKRQTALARNGAGQLAAAEGALTDTVDRTFKIGI